MTKTHHDAADPKEILSPIEAEAAEWVCRRESGLPLPEEEFAEWLVKDPEHERIFLEMQETARLLDSAGETVYTDKQTRETAASVRPRWKAFLQLSLAAAAVLAIVVAGVRQFVARPGMQGETVETQIGEMRRLALYDDSAVLLNTDTAVEVLYRENERRVRLVRGEAYFTVAKDPSRPFWVNAGPVAVRAVGTAFNVRLQDEGVQVLVTEGSVRVAEIGEGKSAATLREDDGGPVVTTGNIAQVSINPAGTARATAMIVSSANPLAIKSTLAWQDGRLEFFETSLAEVVAEFNRYNQRRIVIADPDLAAQRFGGAFSSHRVETLLELLEQSFGVVVEERGSETVIRSAL